MSSHITAQRIISVTILAEKPNGERFTQEISGDEAEKWMDEVTHRLEDYYESTKLPFPAFEWKDMEVCSGSKESN